MFVQQRPPERSSGNILGESYNGMKRMSMTLTYRLPFPPSINHYWRRSGHIIHVSTAGRQFRNEVVEQCGGEIMLLGRLAVNLELTMPTRRKRDIDNYVKSTLDALAHAGVFENDNQIDELRVKRLHVESPGCCDVTITELSTEV